MSGTESEVKSVVKSGLCGEEFQTSSSSSFEFEFELARTFQFLAGSEMSSCLINIKICIFA